MEIVVVIILLIVGIALMLVELFLIPGLSVAGISGFLFMGGSVYYAYAYIGDTAGHLTLFGSVLFTAVGKGTYICDINGKILHTLNYLNAPVWYDENHVAGMVDKDDGHVLTSSTVQLVNIRSNARTQVSRNGEMAMHPSASTGKIAYHTTDGKIIVATVAINP